MRRTSLILSVVLAVLVPLAQADTGIDLPVVPVSTLKRPQSAAPSGASQQPRPLNHPPGGGETVRELRVRPGVNEIVVIAVDHINRIVTPFEAPEVWTGSAADIVTRDNVLYLSTHNDVPVTMYITEQGDESAAISLTLAPREVPPRELRLSFDEGHVPAQANRAAQARRWERAQPYVETLRNLLRAVASGTLPPGYTLREVRDGERAPRCHAPGDAVTYHFDQGQLVAGHDLQVLVGLVSNRTDGSIELSERWCADHGVAGVAYWPRVVLGPREVTEVFVALRTIEDTAPVMRQRPSLVEAGLQ